MDITYNDKVTIDGSSYIYSEGGEIVLNFGSITFKDLFNLEFDLQTNTTSSWNAPLEIEGISGFNIQNAGYSSYFTCIWGNTSHVMDTYPITSEEYVHYHIWQQNGSIFIQITQSNGVSYSYNATYNGSFSTIHLGNYHKENRATGVVKNVKFTTDNNYLDTIGLTSLWSKIKSLFATKTELGSKANDADVVHKSGDETIAGTKTFSSNIVGNLTGNADTATKATTADSATKATQDSDGNQINTTYSKNGHTHDDRYYTETEVNNLLNGKANDSDVVHKSGDAVSGDLRGNGSNNLGTSTNKWKTINGINPGSLGFPAIEFIDYSSSVTSGNEVYIEAPADGWFMLNAYCQSGTKFRCAVENVNLGLEFVTGNIGYHTSFCPIQKGKRVALCVTGTHIFCRFFSCQGNV